MRAVPRSTFGGVMRYLYEREVAPIPPGMVLVRTDHRPECHRMTEMCPHMRCVNPFHVVPRPGRSGLYQREVNYDIASSERSAERKRRVRANRREKERRDDDRREASDQEGLASHGDEGGGG